MSTPTLKSSQISREWHVIDASEATLGRVSTAAAKLLSGKHKPTYTPHIDNGDYVIIINAAKLKVSGKKMQDKLYYRHSGYMGNLKDKTLAQLMEQDPGKVVQLSVKGMLARNKLHNKRLKRLKVYTDDSHEHGAQKPKQVKLHGGKA